jgi:hypothetical protein
VGIRDRDLERFASARSAQVDVLDKTIHDSLAGRLRRQLQLLPHPECALDLDVLSPHSPDRFIIVIARRLSVPITIEHL